MMYTRAAACTMGRTMIRHFTSSYPKPYTVPEGSWGANRAARLELAAAYRGLDMLGLNEGVWNHLSVMAPRADGQGDVMLVFPEGLHWREVKASNLVGLDADAKTVEGDGLPETTASCIHLSIHKMRADARAIMHTHQPYITALGCLEDFQWKMTHQNSLNFWNDVAYDPHYSGIVYTFEEGERLAKMLGTKNVLVMGNHGVLTVAPTVSLAFERLYSLERAAMVQVLAMSTHGKVREIPENVVKLIYPEYLKRAQKYADTFFYSIYRLLQQSQPDFEH